MSTLDIRRDLFGSWKKSLFLNLMLNVGIKSYIEDNKCNYIKSAEFTIHTEMVRLAECGTGRGPGH